MNIIAYLNLELFCSKLWDEMHLLITVVLEFEVQRVLAHLLQLSIGLMWRQLSEGCSHKVPLKCYLVEQFPPMGVPVMYCISWLYR
ncbi:hypothetical protein FH972_011623 [Carpinus fangiana]|uniref:Uncharacterized protein n=1 Tax=Carpinus fangiana TaxID=176857 RepID=A0A660KUZ4_9ROSI|nr:hypothetical protein FH972_011623 [Carpinus fangiana]